MRGRKDLLGEGAGTYDFSQRFLGNDLADNEAEVNYWVEIPSDCTLQSPISLVLFEPKAAGRMVFQDGISFLSLIEKIF